MHTADSDWNESRMRWFWGWHEVGGMAGKLLLLLFLLILLLHHQTEVNSMRGY